MVDAPHAQCSGGEVLRQGSGIRRETDHRRTAPKSRNEERCKAKKFTSGGQSTSVCRVYRRTRGALGCSDLARHFYHPSPAVQPFAVVEGLILGHGGRW